LNTGLGNEIKWNNGQMNKWKE